MPKHQTITVNRDILRVMKSGFYVLKSSIFVHDWGQKAFYIIALVVLLV